MNPLDEVETEQGIRDFARMVALFHLALRSCGVSRGDAIRLTSTWLSAMVIQGRGGE